MRWHPEGWVEVSPPTSAKGFVSENLSVNSYRFFLRLPFVFFWGHRCILNLPYVLRIGVVHFRSPSHQPSTSHHCVLCRWLGESRPALKLSIVSWSTILIEQSLIEVKVAVSLIFCLDHLCGPQRDISFCLWFYQYPLRRSNPLCFRIRRLTRG